MPQAKSKEDYTCPGRSRKLSLNIYLATHIFADSVQEAVSDPDNAISCTFWNGGCGGVEKTSGLVTGRKRTTCDWNLIELPVFL